jgi:hypothetical protein
MATAPTEWVELASSPADDRQSRSRRKRVEPRARRLVFRNWLILVAALTPALAAIWTVPGFVTQDGPAHVYNAQILAWSFDPGSPFRDVYTIRWQPIPNWIGHLVMAGLLAVLSPWVADRILISVTLAGFAVAIFWLRGRVAGKRHRPSAALLAALLAMNITWLLGFYGFLLGACLFPITLGYWWPHRDDLRAGRIVGLSALLVLGYFCHLVSLGLTVLSLIVLALVSPSAPSPRGVASSRWRHRVVPLAVSFLPMVPLGLVYLGLAHRGGPIHPLWSNLADPFSLSAWKTQITWVDPLSLSRKDVLPFTDHVSRAFVLFAPVVWLVTALLIWGLAAVAARLRSWSSGAADDRRGWRVLAALLIVAGLTGPDTLGADHGGYLPQRIVLCGLVALTGVVEIDNRRWSGRAATAALVAGVALQSAIVWDYALDSNRNAGQVLRARDAVGREQRIATLPATIRSRFRANPLYHIGDWLGVDSGNVVWNNYETRHYYFPVQFRPGIDRPHPDELEFVITRDDPREATVRAREWQRILSCHADSIDELIVYKSDPQLDAVTERWFHLVSRRSDVRIFHRNRDRESESSPSR